MGFRTFSEEPTAESAPSSVPSLPLQPANTVGPAEAGDTEEAPDGAGVGDDLADFLWDVQVSTKGKAIRRRPMTEILMGKLCYSLSSTAAVAEVVQTVLRMMDVLAENTNQEDVNPSKSHVRTILVKLDCLHSLSRRVFAKPNQPDRRTVRFLSADSSPQKNYDYFLVTEELMTRDSVHRVPVDASGQVDPWRGFAVERRTMVVTTIARGESSAALKTMRVLHIICLENTAVALPQYRGEVRGFLSDQGTERLICKYPLDTAANVREAVRGFARDTGAAAAAAHERVRALPFFPEALEIPGSLHVVFNTLEAVVKSVPEFEVLHKQLNTVCRLLTPRSYQEVVEVKMLDAGAPAGAGTAADKQALHSFRDNLLEWRWDSLHRVLSQWAPLRLVLLRHWRPEEFGSDVQIAKQITEILEDGMHGWMVVWAGKFAEAATRLAHWIEGCFCHENILVSQPASKRRKTMMEETGSGTCCWKGKRLPELACRKMTDLIQYFTNQARTEYISEMLAAPADVRARVTAIDALATEQLRVVLEQKFAYAQTIPWVAAISEGFRQYSQATTGGAFVDAVSFRAFSGQTLESRQLKAFADSELPLHHYAEAWTLVQEYSFCSLAERGTERQHSEIRNAARRGQRYAGPAVVASRKREKQVVAMIGDPQQLQRMTVVQRLAKVYAYHPDQHFMDVSEEATAQAVYQKALLDASAAARTEDSVPLKLDPAPHQILHFLKSHLRNGSLVSLGEEAFQLALRYTPRQPEEEVDVPCKEMLSQDLWLSLRTEMVVPAVSLDPYFFTVLDARPEQQKDVRADRGRSKSSILVMSHTHVRVLSDTEVQVQSSGNRQEFLELASFCNQARMQVFMHSCRVWTPRASDVSLHVLTAGACRQPDLVPIPDFIQDHEPAASFSNQLRRRQADMQVVEHEPDRVRISAEAIVLLKAEEDLLHELLRHGALGGRHVSVDDLSEFNAAAVQRLQQHGILSGEQGAFGDLTLSIASSLQLLPECTWSEPLSVWELSHFFLTRGKVALTSKIEYFRLLFKQGWKPRCDDESEFFEWHCRDATAELPAQGLGMSLPYLRCLLTSVLLWQKPGNLQRILVNGPSKYYEYLMSSVDLSAVAKLTAEEIRQKFAGARKARATDAVDMALDNDPEQEDRCEVLAAAAAGVAAGSEVLQSDPELLQLNMPKESSRAIVVNGRSCHVYFDNYTHASGQLRAFVQCDRHTNCRLYVFVHKVRGKGRAVAYLQRWLQEASAYPGLNGDRHKQYKPPDTDVDALLLAQAEIGVAKFKLSSLPRNRFADESFGRSGTSSNTEPFPPILAARGGPQQARTDPRTDDETGPGSAADSSDRRSCGRSFRNVANGCELLYFRRRCSGCESNWIQRVRLGLPRNGCTSNFVRLGLLLNGCNGNFVGRRIRRWLSGADYGLKWIEVGGETVQCLGVHYLVEFAESLQSALAVCSASELALASHRDAWMSRPLRRRDREAQDSRLGKDSASQSGQFCKLHVANVFHFADPERRCTLRKQDAFPGNQVVQLHPVSEDCRQRMRTHGAPHELLRHQRSVRSWKVPLALLDSLKGGELVLAVPQGICRNMGLRTFSEEPTAESAPSSVPSLPLQPANTVGPAEAGDTEEAPDGAGVGDDLADFLWDVQVSTKGKAIRRRPMTEILMGKLCYSLSSTAAVAEVVQTVLRMMDVLAENTNQEDVNPSKSHVRTILVKLDCLHSLSRRVFAKPNQPDRRTDHAGAPAGAGTAADKQALHSFRDNLLEWRWDSLHRVLSQWAPLRLVLLRHWRPEEFGSDVQIAKQITEILEDGMHGWMVVWAGKFAEAATRLAHWIEGCFCHENILVSQPASKRRKTMMEETGSGTCCWKGKRLPELACRKMTDLIQYFTNQARTEYISEMLAAPADVRARVTAIDALATEQLRVVLEQKFAYAQTIPWVAAISEGFRQYSQATTGGAFVDAVSFRAFSGQTLGSRQLKAFAGSELPLHHYAEAWTLVQEYSFCSLAERGTERQHSEIRNAARRGQRYAGPAVVASRKREKQVVAMIGDPQQLQFLVAHWRDRQIWEHLLEHCLPKQTVRRMTVVQRLAKVYAYHPDQHFMDVSEEATAQAVYQKALLDASAAARTEDSVPLKLDPAPHQIVHFLKSHLRNGSLVSLGEEAFQLALRYTPRQPEEEADVPCKEMLSQDLWLSLRTEMVVPAVSLDPYFFTVLDARPEQQKDVRADRGRSKSSILVMSHTHVRVLSDTEVQVQSSGNRQEFLELASFCNQARMQVFMHSCRVWTPRASDVSLHVLTAGACRQPDLVPIPDFIQGHEPAASFSNQLRRRQADMQVVEHEPDRVRISAEAIVLLKAEEDLLHELLRHGALGGRHVSVDDLSEFNAAAVQRLQQHGILSGEQGAFGDLTLSIASSLQLLPECTWSEPLSVWELSHFFLTRGKVALTSKIEYFRLLFKQGWKPRCDDESEFFEWHCRDATAELPAQGLGMSLPYLRCLLTSVLLWQKPGNLQRILVNGPSKYYEYLMSSVDLSAVAKLTAEEIRQKFAGARKARATDAVDMALDNDPEQEDRYEVLAAAAAGVAAGSEVPQSDPELLQLNMPKESSRAIVVNGRSCHVYFDNYTHASGQLRAFVQCDRHTNCRLYVFVHKVRGKGRAVAYLQRWLQEASAYPGLNGDRHKQYKPPDTDVDALLLAQAVAQ
ncbi:unnamed protein product [Symbiodinium sp. CCMP2592]|nr:unnamed protein product [Symbiodinium sp. CCMP2592]